MWLICAIDVLVVFTLVRLATKHGLERALPAFVFFLTLIPGECRIVTGVFDLYTDVYKRQRGNRPELRALRPHSES